MGKRYCHEHRALSPTQRRKQKERGRELYRIRKLRNSLRAQIREIDQKFFSKENGGEIW